MSVYPFYTLFKVALLYVICTQIFWSKHTTNTDEIWANSVIYDNLTFKQQARTLSDAHCPRFPTS